MHLVSFLMHSLLTSVNGLSVIHIQSEQVSVGSA